MKKAITLILLILTFTTCLRAQKKELSQARSYIKSGKELNKAEQLMTDLLKQPDNRQNLKVHATLYDAVQAQYDEANKRFYLKQQQDTATFFKLVRRLYTVAETMDSVDALPDTKGRVRPQYRKTHAETLSRLMPNLYSGGAYFIRKQQWQQSFDFYETYLDCFNQPLFADVLTTAAADDKQQHARQLAAYWALYSAYLMHDPVRTLRHRDLALLEQSKRANTLQYVAEAWNELKDDSSYVATLTTGFNEFPRNTYFFPRLIDNYSAKRMYAEALDITDKALESCDTCQLFLYAKASLLLNLGRNDEAIDYAKRVDGDVLHEANYTAAVAMMNKVSRLNELSDKKQITALCSEAKPYMEAYRKQEPDAKDKWAPVLYRIYLNLNMGKEFDEIDQLLKRQ